MLALEVGKCLGAGTLQGLTCEVKVLAGPSWSEPLMYPSRRGVLAWDGRGLGRSPTLLLAGLVNVGWLPFVRTARAVGKGVDCLPMAKPVVRVISWGSAVEWGLG